MQAMEEQFYYFVLTLADSSQREKSTKAFYS